MCIRSSASSGSSEPCLPSSLQPCISWCASSRSIPRATKSSVPTRPLPSWYEPTFGTKCTSRCNALWSPRTLSLSNGPRWNARSLSCRCLPRSISSLSKRGSSSWRHVWSISRWIGRNGSGVGWTQRPQKDEEEDEESTQAWAPQTWQGEIEFKDTPCRTFLWWPLLQVKN